MHQTKVQTARPARQSSQSARGYVLLSVMLLITLMLIAMSIELPRIAQQVKRAKEEELVNRGMDYARAVKRFYHKTNAYPNSIDQLKDTNHVRFLRKEYKDPITGESEWKLVHVNEAEIKIPQGNGVQGLQGSNPGLVGGAGNNPTAQAGGGPGGRANRRQQRILGRKHRIIRRKFWLVRRKFRPVRRKQRLVRRQQWLVRRQYGPFRRKHRLVRRQRYGIVR